MPYGLVIGDPIAHSLSPVIHLAAYRELGLDWDFRKHCVPAGGLADFLAGLDDRVRGLAVTMPLKPEALQVAAYVDGLAKVTGAVNTLVPVSGHLWAGFNTDVRGIVQAFRGVLSGPLPPDSIALIFGSGSTSASALAAFTELGIAQLVVVSRSGSTNAPAAIAAEKMGLELEWLTWDQITQVERVSRQARLLMGTIPAPAQDKLPLENMSINPQAVFMDAAYAPWPTPCAAWAAAGGAQVIPGWEMLLYQGSAQVKLFTGREVTGVEAIRAELMKAK